jgi:3-hydroxyisobutyrate dehydrogenase-like beta-hydroxyacid dehydrogenase
MDKPLAGHKIGFVGLGNMGRANARHLHEAGAEVHVWNRSDAPAEAAVALGMRRAASLPELAREIGDGVICINLTMTDVVEKVVFGVGGLIEGLHKDALIIDLEQQESQRRKHSRNESTGSMRRSPVDRSARRQRR